jgi:IS5 family transposase
VASDGGGDVVMEKQQTFASVAWTQKGKVTRRERFLAEMDAVIPWADLLRLIEPHYPKAGNGRQPLGLEKMLRIYFVQQWFNLSDPQAEDSLYDSESIRRFVRIELSDDVVPDETTILRFRHLLEKHGLTAKMFDLVKELLTAKRLLLKSGTIVDATIISAPSSTKNASKTRDPEMKQTRKGNQWYFGMKLHVGTDTKGRVHRVVATNAATADITQLGDLLHGEESRVYGDQAYWKEADRQEFEASGVRYRMNRRPPGRQPLSERWRRINRARSRIRARGEHPFHIVKRLWGFAKVRYRGLAKNLARAQIMFALANLYSVRHQLMPVGARCTL